MFSYRTNRPSAGRVENSKACEPPVTVETAVDCLGSSHINQPADSHVSSRVEKLLNVSAVGKRLGVGKSTVWKLIWEERLEKVKLLRRALITESSVDRLIAELIEEARLKREAGL